MSARKLIYVLHLLDFFSFTFSFCFNRQYVRKLVTELRLQLNLLFVTVISKLFAYLGFQIVLNRDCLVLS